MLIVQKRLKTEPDAEWDFHEISTDKFPGGFQRESDWAVRYKNNYCLEFKLWKTRFRRNRRQ